MISGFHTPVEQDVLAILARRAANLLWVSTRDLPKSLPKKLKPAVDEGRLLILSPFEYGKQTRISRTTCSVRNRFVMNFTSSHYLPHIAQGRSLSADVGHQFSGSHKYSCNDSSTLSERPLHLLGNFPRFYWRRQSSPSGMRVL